jgi:hypothetical protein
MNLINTICLVVIALSMLAIMVGVFVAVARLRRATDQVEDLVQRGIPAVHHVTDVARHVSEMVEDVRFVELRVAGTTARIVNQIDVPIRQLAALLAGVRAAAGKLFDASHRGRVHATYRTEMRKD